MARYRRGSMFVRDPREHSTPLDRNALARILTLAEALERRTKAKGRRNGRLGYVGLAVLRALLLRFQNRASGVCNPSYDALQTATGLCRESVARGLDRLEAAGILQRTRRIIREIVDGSILVTRQASNLYRLSDPRPGVGEGAPEARPAQPFPARGFLAALAATALRRAESTMKGETTSPIQTDWRKIPDWRQQLARKGSVS